LVPPSNAGNARQAIKAACRLAATSGRQLQRARQFPINGCDHLFTALHLEVSGGSLGLVGGGRRLLAVQFPQPGEASISLHERSFLVCHFAVTICDVLNSLGLDASLLPFE
jgi:hypothetical protein